MKKIISLLCICAILTPVITYADSELLVGEMGISDATGVFDEEETPAPEDKPEDKPESTPTPNPGNSGGGGGGGGGASSSDKEEKPADTEKEEKPEESGKTQNPFSDVSEKEWFYEDVLYAYEKGIMSGVEDGKFSPKTGVTRAMVITVLHRLAGTPDANGAGFSDVADGMWYEKAVAWGAENKIVSGMGDNLFQPDGYITREQLAVILYNYRKMTTDMDPKAELDSYEDSKYISAWAKEAVSWAVANGIISGKSSVSLAPSDGATRAEAAAIIRRYITLTENN